MNGRQILHILSKDVRRLRWEIAAATAAALLLAWFNGDNRLMLHPGDSANRYRLIQLLGILTTGTLGAKWLLTVSLIHGEVIPGLRQFWLTRPYTRTALLAAKLAFLALFLQLPAFLADAITLARAGVSPGGQLGAMLWRQVLHFLVIVAPAVALGSVTANLAQVALAGVGFALLSSLFGMLFASHGMAFVGGLSWWPMAFMLLVFAAATSLILYLQYFRRRSIISLILIGVTVTLSFLIPRVVDLRASFSLQQRLAREPGAGKDFSATPALARGRYVPDPRSQVNDGYMIGVYLPIDFRTPSNFELRAEQVELRLTDEQTGGRPPLAPLWNARITWTEDGKSWLSFQSPRAVFAPLRGRSFRVEADLAVTLFGRPRKISFPFRQSVEAHAGSLGVCASRVELPALMVVCREPYGPRHILRAALRDRQTGVYSKNQPWIGPGGSYAPLHQDVGLSPLTNLFVSFGLLPHKPGDPAPWDLNRLDQTDIEFTSFEPVDHVRRTIRFDSIKLEDYEIVVGATRF